MGVTITLAIDIHEEIECRINMGNACYYSLEKILLSCLLNKKLKFNPLQTYVNIQLELVIKASRPGRVNNYKTFILSVVLYDCETWSLIQRGA